MIIGTISVPLQGPKMCSLNTVIKRPSWVYAAHFFDFLHNLIQIIPIPSLLLSMKSGICCFAWKFLIVLRSPESVVILPFLWGILGTMHRSEGGQDFTPALARNYQDSIARDLRSAWGLIFPQCSALAACSLQCVLHRSQAHMTWPTKLSLLSLVL